MLAMPERSAPKATPAMAPPPPPSAAYVRRAVPALLPDSGVSHRRQTAVTPSNDFNTESYTSVRENEFVTPKDNPLSTLSIDVDTASYSNVRRFLDEEIRPPAGAIRTEELINYFRYNYPQPTGEDPFSVNLEVSRAPWNPERELVRIGLKGRELAAEERGPANLVFLIDVSGSMDEPNKLPLLQRSLSALVENLSNEDRVAIVTYAGSSGLVLAPTEGAKKREILEAITNLRAGGSTHGSEGIRLAYETAREHFREDGNNRVILCTDGDFNVGVTNESELQKLIEKERESGVFLSVLGFGTGNLNDSTMELLANKGNGNYAYIDSISEGRKVLVEQMGSTLFTIAKDVKIQVEFNPARVAGYRLIGYENRLLAKEDFNDDKKDAGEIGAGHTVTALYEIIPAGQAVPGSPSVDPLKYQRPEEGSASASNELLTVKLRYKAPDGEKSKLIEIPLMADDIPAFVAASEDFRFASAVAAFGMKLRGSPDAGKSTWPEIQDIARGALGNDPGSYRAEFLTLIEKAKAIEEAARR
jgi:Ca-activated chloride channel family protein